MKGLTNGSWFMSALLALLFCGLAGTASAQQGITIKFGDATTELGRLKSDTAAWCPLFFSVDAQGNIHIPDGYKHRVAIFDPSGVFIKAVPIKEGLTPGVNWFALANDGSYLSYEDYKIWCHESNGGIRWVLPLFYGAFPKQFHVDDNRLLVVVAASDIAGQKSDTLLNVSLKPPYAASLLNPENEQNLIARTVFAHSQNGKVSQRKILDIDSKGMVSSAEISDKRLFLYRGSQKSVIDFQDESDSPIGVKSFCVALANVSPKKWVYYNEFMESGILIKRVIW